MLDFKKYKADIESGKYPYEWGMTIEFFAFDEKDAENKLDNLCYIRTGFIRGDHKLNWFNLEEIGEDNE